MSTYYDFMVEAKYKDKWYNIDLHTRILTESYGINSKETFRLTYYSIKPTNS